MYIIFFAIGFIVSISVYNIFLRKSKFRNELNMVRKEKILLNKKNDFVDDKLIVYLNQIIKDDKITIVKCPHCNFEADYDSYLEIMKDQAISLLLPDLDVRRALPNSTAIPPHVRHI